MHIVIHYIYIYDIRTHNVFYLSWLAVMWAHWKTPAHGREVLCVKDSVWTVKRRRTWRNCVHGRTSGQSRAELSATWQYFMIVRTHAKVSKDRARSGAGSWKLWCWSKVCSQALLWNNLICVSRCSGKTFTYKVKDRELVLSCLVFPSIFFKTIILKNLTHSINPQMESIHIEPVWGRDQLYQRLCCGWQSPSLHRRSIAHLREGFRSRPCTVTRLQCGRFMAIPFRERTRKLSMRVCWLKEHYLR